MTDGGDSSENRSPIKKLRGILGTGSIDPSPMSPRKLFDSDSSTATATSDTESDRAIFVNPVDVEEMKKQRKEESSIGKYASLFSEPDSDENTVFCQKSSTTERGSTAVTPEKSGEIHSAETKFLRGATLPKLIEFLTSAKYADGEFVESFLLSHYWFVNSRELLELITIRYIGCFESTRRRRDRSMFFDSISDASTEGSSNLSGFGDEYEVDYDCDDDLLREWQNFRKFHLLPIRLRCINLLKQWLTLCPDDFRADPELAARLRAFILTLGRTMMAETLMRLLLDAESGKPGQSSSDFCELSMMASTSSSSPLSASSANGKGPVPIPLVDRPVAYAVNGNDNLTKCPKIRDGGGRNLTMFLVNEPDEIARQITLMQWEMMQKIQVKEFFSYSAFSKEAAIYAPHLTAMVSEGNRLSRFFQNELFSHADLLERALCLEKIIYVCDALLELNNFNSLYFVITALDSTASSHIKKTWELLPPKAWEKYDRAKKLAESSGNYRYLREAEKNAQLPMIPFLGLIQTDIVFMSDGNPNFITKDGCNPEKADITTIVNFNKWRMIASRLRDFRRVQQTAPELSYHFQPVPELQAMLKTSDLMNDDELWKCAKQFEPSGGKKNTEREIESLAKKAAKLNKCIQKNLRIQLLVTHVTDIDQNAPRPIVPERRLREHEQLFNINEFEAYRQALAVQQQQQLQHQQQLQQQSVIVNPLPKHRHHHHHHHRKQRKKQLDLQLGSSDDLQPDKQEQVDQKPSSDDQQPDDKQQQSDE